MPDTRMLTGGIQKLSPHPTEFCKRLCSAGLNIPAFQHSSKSNRLLFCWNAGLINGGGSCRVVLESPAYPSAGRLERRRARLPVGAIGLFGPVAPAVALGVGAVVAPGEPRCPRRRPGGAPRAGSSRRPRGSIAGRRAASAGRAGGLRAAGSMALQRLGVVGIVRTASWTPFAVPFPEGKMDPERPPPQRAAGRAGGQPRGRRQAGTGLGGRSGSTHSQTASGLGVSC